jgi:hypothetical protein
MDRPRGSVGTVVIGCSGVGSIGTGVDGDGGLIDRQWFVIVEGSHSSTTVQHISAIELPNFSPFVITEDLLLALMASVIVSAHFSRGLAVRALEGEWLRTDSPPLWPGNPLPPFALTPVFAGRLMSRLAGWRRDIAGSVRCHNDGSEKLNTCILSLSHMVY